MGDEHDVKAREIAYCTCGDELPVKMRERGEHFANCQAELVPDIAAALREAVAAERKRAADIARERQNYWNTVAYDKRQAGKDDNFACSSAQAAWEIVAAIERDD